MEEKRVLIQGAMDIEIEYLISKLENMEKYIISNFEFFSGIINNIKVIVSKTFIGTINATIATTIGIMKIHTGDIIIGEKCYNINSYSMPSKKEMEGSNPFEWEPDKRAREVKMADESLVSNLKESFKKKYHNPVYIGTLGSGDVFSREIDRIDWINKKFGNLCEDMESIGTYSVCNKLNIPCIGIRIISNNEITGETLDENQAIILQKLLVDSLNNFLYNT